MGQERILREVTNDRSRKSGLFGERLVTCDRGPNTNRSHALPDVSSSAFSAVSARLQSYKGEAFAVEPAQVYTEQSGEVAHRGRGSGSALTQ